MNPIHLDYRSRSIFRVGRHSSAESVLQSFGCPSHLAVTLGINAPTMINHKQHNHCCLFINIHWATLYISKTLSWRCVGWCIWWNYSLGISMAINLDFNLSSSTYLLNEVVFHMAREESRGSFNLNLDDKGNISENWGLTRWHHITMLVFFAAKILRTLIKRS